MNVFRITSHKFHRIQISRISVDEIGYIKNQTDINSKDDMQV